MSKKKDKAPQEDPLQDATNTVEESQTDESQDTDNQPTEEQSKDDNAVGERDELRNKYLRLMAEFENYKKRTVRERVDLLNTAAQDTLTALLPVLDDFDRALNLPEEQRNSPAFQEGIQLVYQKLNNTLKQRGLEVMESTGQDFDPELHEALTEIPAPTEELKGKIVDTIERGYTLKGKIIRYAKVVTGK
ncbi:MAG: nucleotide exchange factor GrpE [Bacteroidota bacterium]